MVNLYLTLKQMYSDITDPRSQKYERSINESFDQFFIDRPTIVQMEAILCLKAMSERVGSDIERL